MAEAAAVGIGTRPRSAVGDRLDLVAAPVAQLADAGGPWHEVDRLPDGAVRRQLGRLLLPGRLLFRLQLVADDLLQQQQLGAAVPEHRFHSPANLPETVDPVSQGRARVHRPTAVVAVQLVDAPQQVGLVGVELAPQRLRRGADLLADSLDVIRARCQSVEVSLQTVCLRSRATTLLSQRLLVPGYKPPAPFKLTTISQSISLIATLRPESRIANDRQLKLIIDKNSKRNKQCAYMYIGAGEMCYEDPS